MKSKSIRALGLVAALVVAGPAAAVSWTTSAQGSVPSSLVSTIYCSDTLGCMTSTPASGNVIKVTAYSTTTAAPADTGMWAAAYLTIYGGNGFGISNTQQAGTLGMSSGSCSGVSMESYACAPEHAIDNAGFDDILVVDFGTNNWDLTSFTFGYTATGTANADVWAGNSFNAATAQFSGGSGSTITGAGNSFTAVAVTPDSAGTGVAHIANSGNAVGRYLIITPDLGGTTDAFKISVISATAPTGVPVPGSLPLLALGLLALTMVQRQRSRARI